MRDLEREAPRRTGCHSPPTQAVILAGGRGTRLGELTAARPKAMLPIHGKPFLEYLLEMLAAQGFERVLLLLGYLPDLIQGYVGDGRRWGLRVDYAVSAAENETGRRIYLARDQIEDVFLLMYCDNYWPLDIKGMWNEFAASDSLAMLTVYSNRDGYSKDGVRLDADRQVLEYDKNHTRGGLKGVEIGYSIVTKLVLSLLPDENVIFEEEVYPKLAERRQLRGFVTDHRYYSIGSPERIPLTETFLARQPAVILDRDGVLNKKPPRAEYVRAWDEFAWIDGAREALRLLKEAGFLVVLASNQAGIGRGAMSEAAVIDIHERLKAAVREAGGEIEAIYYCPHDWDAGCECRKPRPGMLFQAQRDLTLDLSRTVFIGDDERDAQAATAAGCPSILVTAGLSLLDVTRDLLSNRSGRGG